MSMHAKNKLYFIILCAIFFGYKAAFSATAPTVQIEDNVYMIWNQSKLNWHEALQACATQQMQLVSLENVNKLVQLNTYLMKQNYIDRPEIGNDYIYWIAGNDLAAEGEFSWATTGAKFEYTNWLPHQPDNKHGKEHCVEMGYRVLGRWNDIDCGRRRHFICERKATVGEKLA